jgi:hypothetical protein
LIEKIKEIKTQLEKKKKNIKNINSSLKNNNKSEASPEE